MRDQRTKKQTTQAHLDAEVIAAFVSWLDKREKATGDELAPEGSRRAAANAGKHRAYVEIIEYMRDHGIT